MECGSDGFRLYGEWVVSLALVSFPTWGAVGVEIDASGENADA